MPLPYYFDSDDKIERDLHHSGCPGHLRCSDHGQGIIPAAKQGTGIMNTNFSGIRELSADDLGSVSGGSPILTVPVRLVEKIFGGKSFVETLIEKGTGTLKGLTPRPPK